MIAVGFGLAWGVREFSERGPAADSGVPPAVASPSPGSLPRQPSKASSGGGFDEVLLGLLERQRIPAVDIKRNVLVRREEGRTIRYWSIFVSPERDVDPIVHVLEREARRRGAAFTSGDAPERGGYAMKSADIRLPSETYKILIASRAAGGAAGGAELEAPHPAAGLVQRAEPKPVPSRLPLTIDSSAAAPRIAILIDDVGAELDIVAEAGQIPYALTFAVIPRLPHSREAAERLTGQGYEIICHLPMQPANYPRDNPGERAIFASMGTEEIRALTASELDEIPGIRGVNNHMGSRITSDRRLIQPVLEVVKKRGLYFIDSRTIETTVAYDVAQELRIPSAQRSIFLDDFEDEAYIRGQLELLCQRARQDGEAVGIGHIHPSTIRTLAAALPEIVRQGFEIVSASKIVR